MAERMQDLRREKRGGLGPIWCENYAECRAKIPRDIAGFGAKIPQRPRVAEREAAQKAFLLRSSDQRCDGAFPQTRSGSRCRRERAMPPPLGSTWGCRQWTMTSKLGIVRVLLGRRAAKYLHDWGGADRFSRTRNCFRLCGTGGQIYACLRRRRADGAKSRTLATSRSTRRKWGNGRQKRRMVCHFDVSTSATRTRPSTTKQTQVQGVHTDMVLGLA